MTQERSNYTGQYFRFVFGKIKGCFIFSVIFSVFCIPPFCLSHKEPSAAANAIELSLALISMIGLLVIAFITPLIAMKHLYTKTAADNILSLPLTAAQRYFCEVGATLLCLAVPFGVISIPFSAVVLPLYLSTAIHGLLFIVMLCMFDIFLMTLCGRLAEAILYPIALNILLPLVIWFGMHLGMMNIFGCGDYDFGNYMTYSTMRIYWTGVTILSFFSPFGNFIALVTFGGESEIAVVTSLIFIVLMIPLGLLTYSKRHSENIGRSFVYKHVYAITSVTVSLFAVVCFFWAAENYLRDEDGGKGFFDLIPTAIPVLVVGLLFLMLIMEIVNYKKVGSFPKFLLRYVGVLAAGTLVSFVLYESEGFGESTYVPSVEDTVYIVTSSTRWSNMGEADYHDLSLDVTTEGDSELAEYLRSVHRTLTQDRENGNKYEYGYSEGSEIGLSYYLKNGSVIHRGYYTDLPADHWKTIVQSEEYRYSALLMTDQDACYTYTWNTTTYDESFTRLTEIEPVAVRLSNVAVGNSDRAGVRGNSILIEEIDYYELREALEADLRNDPDFGRHNGIPIGNLQYGRMYNIDDTEDGERYFSPHMFGFCYTIYESYTNTIELLSRYAEIPTAEETVEKILNHCEYFTLSRILVPKCPSEQGVISFGRFASLTMGKGDEHQDEALITGEQFIEALSHKAQYIYDNGERDYVYVILCGAPNAMSSEVKGSQLHSWLFDPPVLISEEFYDTLDEWYEKGFIPTEVETENTSLSVDYACHAR